MKTEKCGIYEIRCRATAKLYIGSSKQIYRRWWQHRAALRKQKHHSPRLQNAWNKYGESAFEFAVLEECEPQMLEAREQHFIDKIGPDFNCIIDVKRRMGPEILAKRAASIHARAIKITHCPRGHAYDKENTWYNQGKRICRRCALDRDAKKLAAETPEQRFARIQKMRKTYLANREARLAKVKEYGASHRDEKRAYDKQYLEVRRERRKARQLTQEEIEERRAKKKAYYWANREHCILALRRQAARRKERESLRASAGDFA